MATHTNIAGGWVRREARLTACRGSALLALLAAGTLAAWAAPLPLLPTVMIQLCILAGIGIVDRRFTPLVERKARGAGAEERVGALLDAVDGWHAMHDVDLGRGNIDHVVIGPGGVLTVETKSWRGFFDPAKADERWWCQAYAQSKAIESIVGRDVDPLVVVAGARTRRAVERRRGALVMPDRLLAGHLARRRVVMTEDEVIAALARLDAEITERR